MVSLKVMIQHIFTQTIIHVFLMRIVLVFWIMRPERVVEGKLLLLHNLSRLHPRIGRIVVVWYNKLRSLSHRVHLNETFCASLNLYTSSALQYLLEPSCNLLTSWQEPSDPHYHLNIPPWNTHLISSTGRDTSLSTPQTRRRRRAPKTANGRPVAAQLMRHSRHQTQIESHTTELILNVENERARSLCQAEEHEIDVDGVVLVCLRGGRYRLPGELCKRDGARRGLIARSVIVCG